MNKEYKYMIYQGDNLIAESDDTPGKWMKLKEGVTDYPISLFGYGEDKKEEVCITDLMKWAECRACPPNRCGIEKILKELKLDKYDAFKIAMASNFRTMHDDYRVEGVAYAKD